MNDTAAYVVGAHEHSHNERNVGILVSKNGWLRHDMPSFYNVIFFVYHTRHSFSTSNEGILDACIYLNIQTHTNGMILDLFLFVQQIWALLKYLRFARFDYTDLCCIQIYFNARLLRASMATKTIPAHTAAHMQTCCIYVFKSSDGGFAFNFISLHLRYERTYIRLHVVSCEMRKVFFYLFVVETFFMRRIF